MTSARSSSPGFSIIELMFSMAIGSMTLIVATTLLGTTGDQYERTGGGVAAEREGRAVFYQLAADLSSAVICDDMPFKDQERWESGHAAFLTLQTAEAQSEAESVGDLCAVHYYVKDLLIGGQTVRCLLRGLRESKATMAAIKLGNLIPLMQTEHPSDDVIAFGVVFFKVTRAVTDLSRNTEHHLIGSQHHAKVELIIARRELAARLKTAADWEDAKNFRERDESRTAAESDSQKEIYQTSMRIGAL